MSSVFTEYANAIEDLKHVAIHGWGKSIESDGLPGGAKSKGSFTKHDHKSIEMLKQQERNAQKIANFINAFLRTRELEILGCTPYEDCKDVVGWKCGNLRADGSCAIKRDEVAV